MSVQKTALKTAIANAWRWREEKGLIPGFEALRVFHGPGENLGKSFETCAASRIAIDRFGSYFWITEWAEAGNTSVGIESDLPQIEEFLVEKGAKGAVILLRPEKSVPSDPKLLFGEVPSESYAVREEEGQFLIRLLGVRHPGLFLDHLPLRQWLRAEMRDLRVLNTFSYTGSLSVSAGLSGARHVTTLDLSKPMIQWAQDNWELNGLSADAARFISGDYFEWLPRLKREGKRFDCVILDPPSFSRGNKGTFSTSKDLKKLHRLALEVLEPGGYLVSSINSANVSRDKYEAEVLAAVSEQGLKTQVVRRIELPSSFPVRPGERSYLKGLILRIS